MWDWFYELQLNGSSQIDGGQRMWPVKRWLRRIDIGQWGGSSPASPDGRLLPDKPPTPPDAYEIDDVSADLVSLRSGMLAILWDATYYAIEEPRAVDARKWRVLTPPNSPTKIRK